MAHRHGHDLLHRRDFFGIPNPFDSSNDGNNNQPSPPKPTQFNPFGQAPSPSPKVVTVVKTMTRGVPPSNNGNDNGGSSDNSNNNDGSNQQQTSQIQSSDNQQTSAVDSIETDSAQSTEVNPLPTTSAQPTTQEVIPTTSMSIPSTLAIATDSPTAATLAPVSSASATASPSSGDSSGPSTGAKAGIAIGVLAGILGIFVLALFLYNKRRKQVEERADDEKSENPNPFADPVGASARHPPGKAPRLSLRPVTQFMPTIGRSGPQHPDRRQSRGAGAMIPMVQNPQSPDRGQQQSAWGRPGTAGQDPANPFGNHAAIGNEPHDGSVSPVTPIDGNRNLPPPSPMDGKPLPTISDAALAGAAGATGAAVGAGLTRKTSIRRDGPAALDLTLPPKLDAVPASPAGTEFSFNELPPNQQPDPSSSAAAIAAAGGPPSSTVHRVQLDFKPTLEDEMELRAGQLVRLLHEYDDGWALCIRLDRSQQGVVPRTCLSTRPVKPRPAGNGAPRGPPVNPQRGPGPNGYPGGPQHRGPRGPGGPDSQMRPGSSRGQGPMRPQSPAGMRRPESPAGGRMSPAPRSQSPAGGPRFQQGRPQSPAGMRSQSPAGGMRSQSPAGQRRMSPPGMGPGMSAMNPQRNGPPAGPVGRKPVPGQAY